MAHNKIDAELWDKMHYMLRRVNDRMIHISLHYNGQIDEQFFSNALEYMIENTPVLHSSFHADFFKSYWQIEKYSIDDVFFCSEAMDCELAADNYLLQEIPLDSNVQIKIAMFRDNSSVWFAALVNHQCMDGGDFFEFLKDLFRNYDALLSGKTQELRVKSGSRSHKEIYSDLGQKEHFISRFLYLYRGKIKNGAYFPLDAPGIKDQRRIVKMSVPKELMSKIVSIARERSVTVNDIITAALISSLYDVCNRPEEEAMAVSCAVNLRRKRNDHCSNTGYTNHTAWMVCRADCKSTAPWKLIEYINKQTSDIKSDPYLGLYSLPLLNTVFYLFPFAVSEKLVSICYGNPPVAMSNIGRIDETSFSVQGATLVGGYMAGSMKDKPYFMFTVSTVANETTFASAINGTENDFSKVERLMSECIDFLESILNTDL